MSYRLILASQQQSLLSDATLSDVMAMRDNQGNNGVHMAAERGRLQCVQLLLQHFPQLVKDENRNKLSPAVLAVKVGLLYMKR